MEFDESQTPNRMIPADPVHDDVRWSCSVRAVIEDRFPDDADDIVDQKMPWRRAVTDV
jgi:hypothetical protein